MDACPAPRHRRYGSAQVVDRMYSICSKRRAGLGTSAYLLLGGRSWLKMKFCLTIGIALVIPSCLASAQDLAAGAVQFKKCAPCHDVGGTAKNKIGPVLNGIDGRKSGTVPGFKYSDANKGSGIVWDETQFLDYIKDPKAKIPGTIMVFVGLKNEEDANNLWAYLKQFDAEGKKK
jgi:cytochrome c